jgi:uncharacterized membrane protein
VPGHDPCYSFGKKWNSGGMIRRIEGYVDERFDTLGGMEHITCRGTGSTGSACLKLAQPSFGRLSFSAKAVTLALGAAWLFFLPNTCYLLTEWRHFLDAMEYLRLPYRWQTDSGATVDLMMHTLFYMCYSGFGLLTFALAVRPIARLFRNSGADLWVWGFPLFILNSLGVYLGLVLRFNSWEMLTQPSKIWASVASISSRPVLLSFIIAFAGFLWLAYVIMDIWVDGFIVRWKQIKEHG